MRNIFALLCVGTPFLAPVRDLQDGATPQPGTFGQIASQSADLRLADAVPHQDTRGGTLQQLVCAAGAKGGFALLWRDLREGMMGLYLGRFDSEGKIREPERPIHQPYAGRRLQPNLCVDPTGAGVTLWTCDFLNVPVLYAHAFDAAGAWQASDQPLSEVPQQMHDAKERAQGVQLPNAAPLPGGGFAVAWTMRGGIYWTEVQKDGTRKAEPQRLSPHAQPAEPGVQLSGNGKQDPIAVWPAGGKLYALSLRTPKSEPHELGPGSLIRSLATDDGGAWLLLGGEKGSSARRLHADGRPDGEALPVCAPGEQALDLARVGSLLAVLVQTEGAKAGETPGRGRGGRTQSASAGARFELRLLDPDHPGQPRVLEFLSEKAKLAGTPLVASDGTRLLVAWTDSREGDADVYARLVDPAGKEPLGPEFRANTDRASADQNGYRISTNGSFGVVTWDDRRDSASRAYARRIRAPGSFSGDEFLIPGQDPKAGAGPVAPALRADGSCGFLWAESTGVLRFFGQDAAGAPIADPLGIAEGAKDCALAALPAEQGWLAAWVGPEPAVWALRLDSKGAVAGEKRMLSREGKAPLANLELCHLGGRRFAAVWDANDGGLKIRGRFLGLDAAPAGEEFELEGSPRHQDWDPAIAPVGNGGFAVAWTSGATDDGQRDVVARFFDGEAHPSGPLLWISPLANEQDFPDLARLQDGTWAVAWEDDISGLDNTYVRRIEKDQRTLGPIARINVLATRSIQDRVAPHVAPLADGLLFAFGDRARSLGWDVRVRITGPRFDEVPPPAEKH